MISRRGSFLVAFASLIGGCAAPVERSKAPRESVRIDPAMLERAVQRAPIAADQDLRADTLMESEEFSAHLLQFRTGETRHIHRTHDLTFVVQNGEGDVFVADRRFQASRGDVFHIPRGTPHYCVNTGPRPLVALLIFTPPFDLKDSIPVPLGDSSYPRE